MKPSERSVLAESSECILQLPNGEGTHLVPISQDVQGLRRSTYSNAPVREAEQEL